MPAARPIRAAVLWTLLSLLAPAAARAATTFDLLAASPREVSVRCSAGDAEIGRTDDGLLYVSEARWGSEPVSAEVSLPAATRWVALPPGATAELTYAVDQSEPLEWPIGSSTTEIQAWSRSIPVAPAVLQAPSWMRNLYGAPIVVSPVYLDAAGRLRWVRRMELHVSIESAGQITGTSALGRRASGRDPFESLYEEMVLNYETSKDWRRPSTTTAARGGDSFGSATRPWIKVFVRTEDLFAIRGRDLEALGLDLSEIDPLSLRLFTSSNAPLPEATRYIDLPSWMQEAAIRVVDGGDGSFDASDEILFYGVPPDAWYSMRGQASTATERHLNDPYSNENVYWLTWDGGFEGAPRRMDESETAPNEPYTSAVIDRLHFEDLDREIIYDPRPRTRTNETPVFWEKFWWRRLRGEPSNHTSSLDLSLPDAVITSPVEVRIRLWGQNNPSTGLNPPPKDHNVSVLLNDHDLGTYRWDEIKRNDVQVSGTWLAAGAQRFTFDQEVITDPTEPARVDRVLLAWIECDYTRQLRAEHDSLSVFLGGLAGPASVEIEGVQAVDPLVLDVSDPASPLLLRAESGGGGRLRAAVTAHGEPPVRLLLRDPAALNSPRLELDSAPAGGYLRDRTAATQMIILTEKSLRAPAEQLAEYRQTHFPGRETAAVEVVDVDQVFDEFSFGRVDPVAIRNFLAFTRDHWTGGNPDDAPSYVLFLGDAYYDYRDLLREGGANLVPTYEGYWDQNLLFSIYSPQFGSDDFYALLDGPTDPGLDFATGRFPVENLSQAQAMVAKTIHYADSDPGAWRSRATFVADDRCQGLLRDTLHYLHTRQTESLIDGFTPPSIFPDKVYLLEYLGEDCLYNAKPQAQQDLKDVMNDGTLIVNYTGHGSEVQLADERVFELSAVPSLDNLDRLFLFVTASCSVGKYDHKGEGLGEGLARYRDGGAIAVFSASAVATSSGNAALNQKLFGFLFPSGRPGLTPTLGVAAVAAKASLGAGLNRLRYNLLGDPTVRLLAPGEEMSLSLRANGEPEESSLPRGSRIDLSGSVLDLNGQVDSGFAGDLDLLVFDSDVIRDREFVDQGSTYRVTYPILGAPIFRGTAPVEAGSFHVAFQTPSALRTGTRGGARLFVYAADGDADASGVLDSLLVPEEAPAPSSDRVGPTIQLAVEGNLEALPAGAGFTATLHDTSGINITGLVPSRSVVVRVEDDGVPVAVEDLAARVQFGADFRTATVTGAVPTGLTPGGRYDLVLNVSDNWNNQSSERVSFVQSGGAGGEFGLREVYNFPNPTSGDTRFFGELGDDAEVQIKLFTVTGREIQRLGPLRLTPARFQSEGIAWDGRDADGDPLGNGIYLYKVTARPVAGGAARSRIGRLVVSR